MPRSGLRVALTLLVLVAGLALAWILWGQEEEGAGLAGAADAQRPAAAGILPDPPQAGDLQRSDAELAGGAGDAGGPLPASTATVDRDRDLHGIVLGPDGQPFPGAQVTVRLPALQGRGGLDLMMTYASEEVARLISAADGTFSAAVEPGRRYDLDARAPGYVAPFLRACQAGERAELRLHAAASLSGRVLQPDGETLVPDAGLRLFGYGGSGRTVSGRSDASGAYRFDDLELADWRLEVKVSGWPDQDWHTFVLQPGAETTLDVLLTAGEFLRGKVVNAETGLPIPGAEVAASWVFRPSVLAGADGSFVLPLRMYAGENWECHARAPGFGRRAWEHEGKLPAEPLVLELQAGRTLTGRITGAGRPLDGAYVAAVASSLWGGAGQQIDWLAVRSGADGSFLIEDLRPDVPHALHARHPGYGTITCELPPAEMQLPRLDLGTIDLAPAARIAGRVVDDAGAPIAGLSLRLEGQNSDRARWNEQRQQGLAYYVESVEGRTDDLGRFAFTDLAAGSYRLTGQRQSVKVGDALSITIASGEQRAGIELIVATGLPIGGQVFDPSGQPVQGVRVFASGETGTDAPALKPTGADGAFLIPGLKPGNYRVEFHPPRHGDAPLQPGALFELTITDVAAGAEQLRVELPWLSGIRGIVLDADGAPARASVSGWRLDGEPFNSTVTGTDGRFLLTLPAGMTVDLTASPRRPIEGGRVLVSDDVQVRMPGVTAGATDLVLRLPRVP